MQRLLLAATLSLIATACVWSPPAATSIGAELTAPIGADLAIPVEVGGQSLRLRVSGGGLGGIVLNPDAAARLQLQGSRADVRIGATTVAGQSALAPTRLGDWTGKQRIFWFDRPIAPGVDGTISIARLPYDRVVLRLGPSHAEDRAFPFATEAGFFADINYTQEIAGETFTVRFEPDKPRTTASAAAGALLADHHRGKWTGDAVSHAIAFAVNRPVRPMTLAMPMTLGGLTIPSVWVRTSDYGGKLALPQDAADPNEIVVSGSPGTRKPSYILSLGRDSLQGCGTVVYERATRVLTLNCRSAGG